MEREHLEPVLVVNDHVLASVVSAYLHSDPAAWVCAEPGALEQADFEDLGCALSALARAEEIFDEIHVSGTQQGHEVAATV